MKYISLFAGIGGFDLALNRLGHTCVYANDFDKYCKIIYDKNFPREIHNGNGEIERGHGISEAPQSSMEAERQDIRSNGNISNNHGAGDTGKVSCYDYKKYGLDTRSITEVPTAEIPDHDLLTGGFPCQSFSIAGQRKGFEDTRGTMFFEIARILKDKRPRYLLLENVKGLLSHDQGKTFSTILGVLSDLGYDAQWQVLNSKNFGVPQNRERVFIVGHLRGTRRPEVFPIRNNESVHSQAVGTEEAQSQTKLSTTVRADMGSKADGTFVQRVPLKFLNRNQRNIAGDYAYTIDSANTGGVMVGTLRTHKDGNGFREMKSGLAPTIPARAREDGSGQGVIMQVQNPLMGQTKYGNHFEQGVYTSDGITRSLKSTEGSGNKPKVILYDETDIVIRRLTPVECCRLQGFPDDWVNGVSDTQKYKMMGNAVTVNVVEEVMRRVI